MTRILKCFFAFILLLTLTGVNFAKNEQEKADIVYEIPHLIPVKVKKIDSRTGEFTELGFNVDERMLQFYNTTKEEIERGHIEEIDASTAEIVVKAGLRIPIQVRTDEVVKIHNKKGKVMFNLSKFGFMSRKMKDLEGDKTLDPSEQTLVLKWPEIIPCNLTSLLVSIASSSVEVISQNSVVVRKEIFGTFNNETWWSGQGILLSVVNPFSCDVTFSEVFLTGDFGYFRSLIWALDSIAVGRVVVLASLRDGSVVLNDARQKMTTLGSAWSKFYAFRDGWIVTFIKGGKTLNEILVPNFRGLLASGSPVSMHVNIPPKSIKESKNKCYENWPSTAAWAARKHFCDTYDGYGQLCDCTNPFIIGGHIAIHAGESIPQAIEHIPMVILAGNRTRHLFRLLHSIGSQPGVKSESFLLSVDGHQESTEKLAFILGVKSLIHRSEGISGKAKVANNLRFGLYNAHKTFPTAQNFIVLEDDLLLAPDFYAYMTYLAPIFTLDKSIFCVSAFNHLAFPHTSSDPSRIYRAHTNPSLGWMISREILEFMVPKILPQQIDGDWDYFLGSEFVRGEREILIPEINRSYHASTSGLHVTGSLGTELMYLSRNLNNKTDVKMMPLLSLTKDEYEKDIQELLSKAAAVKLNDEGIFIPPIHAGGVYALYVKKLNIDDEDSFMSVGDVLKIWSNDARDHHNHAWRMNYLNATLFVVGVPVSPYTKYLPKNFSILSASNTIFDEILANQREAYLTLPVLTHMQEGNLPEFYYSLITSNSSSRINNTSLNFNYYQYSRKF